MLVTLRAPRMRETMRYCGPTHTHTQNSAQHTNRHTHTLTHIIIAVCRSALRRMRNALTSYFQYAASLSAQPAATHAPMNEFVYA